MLFQYEKAWKRTNEIKMAREEMKESFKEIIGALTHEKAKESAAWGAMMDDNDDLNITPKTDAIAGEATATDTQIHVAPICGPTQTSYIPTSTTTASSQQTRACYYAPYCKKEASICGGWKKGACNDFKAKVFTIPDDFLDEKEELKELAKRRREKERAERNKKSKQNRDWYVNPVKVSIFYAINFTSTFIVRFCTLLSILLPMTWTSSTCTVQHCIFMFWL